MRPHQFLQAGSGRGGDVVAGVATVVEVNADEPDLLFA
jgi:hypothetical protein